MKIQKGYEDELRIEAVTLMLSFNFQLWLGVKPGLKCFHFAEIREQVVLAIIIIIISSIIARIIIMRTTIIIIIIITPPSQDAIARCAAQSHLVSVH